jgi:hypothetical protein
LFAAVKAIQGRLCWQSDKIGVDAPSHLVTPELLAAVAAHKAELEPFMPPRPQPLATGDSDEALKYENDPFVQALRRALEQP